MLDKAKIASEQVLVNEVSEVSIVLLTFLLFHTQLLFKKYRQPFLNRLWIYLMFAAWFHKYGKAVTSRICTSKRRPFCNLIPAVVIEQEEIKHISLRCEPWKHLRRENLPPPVRTSWRKQIFGCRAIWKWASNNNNRCLLYAMSMVKRQISLPAYDVDGI